MTNLALAPDDTRAPAEGARAAAALAARIAVPRQLPPRHDGEPLRHLSPSSYSLWVTCPEAWRLRYLQGRKEPTSGAMFLGSRVDDALSLYYQRILEHGERLELAQVKDAYRELWRTGLHAEEQKLGVDWQDIEQPKAFELGLRALELTFEQFVPKLGEPLAVQRRLEFPLAPGLVEWTIVCYLDLETRGTGPAGEQIHRVVDYKVKASPINQPKADRDPQASLYLAGRWLEGRPVFRMSSTSTVTYRGPGFARRGASF